MTSAQTSDHRRVLPWVFGALAAVMIFNGVAFWSSRPARTFNEGHRAAADRQLLFSVERAGNRLYLMGITHQGELSLYPMRGEIEALFASSDALATERDLTRPLPPEFSQGPFAAKVAPAQAEAVRQLARTYQIEVQSIESLDALAVLSVFEDKIARLAGLEARFGLDQYWTYRARQMGKPILEVEGLDFELEIAQKLVANASDEVLAQIPADPAAASQVMRQHYEAILAGDFQKESLAADRDQARFPAFQALYWDQRNEKMMTGILDWLDQGQCVFVAVGAGHLLGSQGLVARLQEQGCTVSQVH